MSNAHSPEAVTILTPETLKAQLGDKNLLLIQVTRPEVYEQAHLPGAVLATPPQLVGGIPPATGRLPELDQLNALFTSIGYTPDANVVVYDDEGGGWAGRMAWTLDVIGHRSWSYLDGGMHAWAAAGLAFDTGAFVPSSAPLAAPLSVDRAPIAEIEDVLATMDDPTQTVWDVRSAEEFAGLRQAAERVGHVPGAVNLDWLYLKDPATQLLTMHTADDLAAAGVPVSGRLITHCQTHHRSGLSYMLGRLLGLDIRAYHGSWSEWGNRYDTPVETPLNQQEHP